MQIKKKYWPLLKAIEEAAKIGIEVSKPTLIKWIHEHKFGFQLGDKGGKWYVIPKKYLRYINGEKINKSSDKTNSTTPANTESNQQETI